MDIKRIGLMTATAAVGFTLWIKWNHEHDARVAAAAQQTAMPVQTSHHALPDRHHSSGKQHRDQPSTASLHPVRIKTDVLDISIDPRTATVSSAKLLKYYTAVGEAKSPMSILSSRSATSNQQYVLTNKLYQNNAPLGVTYTTSQSKYVMKPSQKTMVVDLTARHNGLVIDKKFTFTRGKYSVDVKTSVVNNSKSTVDLQQGYGIVRSQPKTDRLHFNGASYSAGSEDYTKLSYGKMDKNNLNLNTNSGWVAMQQHYFLSAWIPPQKQSQQFYTKVDTKNGQNYTIGSMLNFSLTPNQTLSRHAIFYVGPENTDVLAGLAPHLERTVDYGWFSLISSFIFEIMKRIHQVVGNWGWTIVLITLLIRVLLYYPSAKSYQSMARMRELQPKIKILQDRYKEDRQALSQEMIKLYRTEKVNPLGGCWPLLLQFPILIALYHLLGASVELRQAPFIFWIHDLSVKDPFFILPILMGLTMFAQQKLNPPPPDPTQARVMMLLPLVMTVFFLHFAAGLTLYWLTNNVLSFAQQAYIMKSFNPKEADKKLRYKKRAKRRA